MPLGASADSSGLTDDKREVGVVATASNTASATNGTATVTFAAVAGKRHRLEALEWSFSANPAAAAALTVADGATTVFSLDITTGGPGFIPIVPAIVGTVNTAMTVNLAAGGAAVVGKVNARAVTEK